MVLLKKTGTNLTKLKYGNFLEADTEAIVNTVNTKGVMGKGIALQFKKAFPDMYNEYKKECLSGKIQIGKMHVYKNKSLLGPKYLINFPTKIKWQDPSSIEYIERGLDDLVKVIKKYEIRSISIPALGCGQGGLDWNKVYALMMSKFEDIKYVDVFIYPPQKSPPAERIITKTDRPKMTLSRALMIFILEQYKVLGYELTLLEMQKLLYFLQVTGVFLNLRFQKSDYGPYADNLRHVLNLLERHFIEGFADGVSNPFTTIKLLPDAIKEAKKFIINEEQTNPSIKQKIDKVLNLIEGFESPYGLELLSTVHWVAVQDKINEKNKALEAVHNWNKRKRNLMKPEHVFLAWDRLSNQNWI